VKEIVREFFSSSLRRSASVGQKLSDDDSLGLGEEDGDVYGPLAHFSSHLLSALQGRFGSDLLNQLFSDFPSCPIPTFGFWCGWSRDTLGKASGASVDLKSGEAESRRLCAAVVDANVEVEIEVTAFAIARACLFPCIPEQARRGSTLRSVAWKQWDTLNRQGG
jgi:hypothetical protein